MKFVVSPSAGLEGTIKVAGDKSISHRAVIFGSIANGDTQISDLLEGEDVLATINAFRAMGIQITRNSADPNTQNYLIEGKGLHGLKQPMMPLDMGNSGTACRLLCGLLCAQPWSSSLIGDKSLTQRPMGRVIAPLSLMGAKIDSTDGKPPLSFKPVGRLNGIVYNMPMASAQVKSAILLAGLYAEGRTRIKEKATTRDHTERMLSSFGHDVNLDHGVVSISAGSALTAQSIVVPADLSSAAFFIVAALIARDSEIVLKSVGVNPSRAGVIDILCRMGGQIELENKAITSGEPVADIRVASSKLTGCEIRGSDIALAIDEIPAIAIAAACATGVTKISGAEELRVKESDRIHSVVTGLNKLGIDAIEHIDGMTIEGGQLKSGIVNSFDDHRIAMAFAIAGVAAEGDVTVLKCENVATSFPNFHEFAILMGINILADAS